MERRFDILFSIRLDHEAYPVGQDLPFSLRPTAACQRVLARYAWVFKPNDRGGFVAVEKLVEGATKQPTFPLRGPVELGFWLDSRDTSVLNATLPWASETGKPVSELATSSLLCFDNLQPGATELAAAGGKASHNDTYFLYRPQFDVRGVSTVAVTSLTPGKPQRQLTPKPGASAIQVALEPGAYEVRRGALPAERALLQPDLRSGPTLGLVRIFVTDSNAVRVDYTVSFAKK
jgi:hypothetical protein